MATNTSLPQRLSEKELADILCNATPNLFGSILFINKVKTFVRQQDTVDQLFGGKISRRSTISGIAMTENYGKAVNNARERNGLEADFTPDELPWGEYYNGSRMIITHVKKGKTEADRKYYLRYRHTRNINGETTYIDASGNVLDYDAIEQYLTKGERRSSKEASKEATAERQGLDVEESVQWRCIDLSHIVDLAYGGNRYSVIDDTIPMEGAVTAPATVTETETAEQEETERRNS